MCSSDLGLSVLIVWFASRDIDMGTLQVGDMIAFITYSMLIVMSFMMLTMMILFLPRAGIAAERIDSVINAEISIKDSDSLSNDKLKNIKGSITFESVHFQYPGAIREVLEDISFTAEAGKITAIIGSTGCGKSTLLNLILRFYDVTSGKIYIDGIDIRDIKLHKLHDSIGYIPQKGMLFSGTVESNLKFGGNNISDEDMIKAAEIAQASDFITEKPDAYKSSISQGGSNVSGGQRQRLAIARALAKKPKILLFDDSFSALDFKTDAALRCAISKNTDNSTIIIVAQRVNTIMNADRIIVLEKGRIAGIGTHKQLMKSCPEYMEIAESQLAQQSSE